MKERFGALPLGESHLERLRDEILAPAALASEALETGDLLHVEGLLSAIEVNAGKLVRELEVR